MQLGENKGQSELAKSRRPETANSDAGWGSRLGFPMLKRLVVGLVLGTVIGAVAAAVLVQGLGITSFSAVVAYLAAAATGAITGLVAGKPIWSADGKIEAGLKAFFGVLLALGGMFVLRQWVHVHVDLAMLKAGAGDIGQLPAASLPIIGAILSTFFELDNTPGADDGKKEDAKDAGAKSQPGKKVRVAEQEDDADEELEEPAPAKKKR